MCETSRQFEVHFEHDASTVAAVARIADYENAQKCKASQQQWVRTWLNWPLAILPLVVLLVWKYDGLPRWMNEWLTHREVTLIAISLFVSGIAWFLTGYVTRGRVSSSFEERLRIARASQILGSVTFLADDQGICSRGKSVALHLGWRQVAQIDTTTTPDVIVIRSLFDFAIAVPVVAFGSSGADAFLRLARESMRAAQHSTPSTTKTVTVDFVPTIEDQMAIHDYSRRIAWGRFYGRGLISVAWIAFFLVTALLVGVVTLSISSPEGPIWSTLNGRSALVVLSCFSLTLGLMPLLLIWQNSSTGQRRTATRHVRRRGTGPGFFDRRRFTVAADGLHVTVGDFAVFHAWKDIEKIVTHGRHLFLCLTHASSGVTAYIVSRDAFENDVSFIEFAGMAETYWQSARSDA